VFATGGARIGPVELGWRSGLSMLSEWIYPAGVRCCAARLVDALTPADQPDTTEYKRLRSWISFDARCGLERGRVLGSGCANYRRRPDCVRHDYKR
jgi:hypothetical protein